ncbi:unnamed protein product [Polarella glacialis]|uniref:Uncharacterized protein n=1 Tax=Polarella glacialis TaxID=89957 RepID=A0A813LVX9_POLGL|nr:unnamed protein product [Polarella glacialis]CAE8739574.1 unnamed protein product [Polarella glacialis]
MVGRAIATAWSGFYNDILKGTKGDMRFESFVIDVKSVRGGGADTVGEFVLKGTRNGKFIKFTKQYVGRHAIGYEGTLVDLEGGNQKIVGECYFPHQGPKGSPDNLVVSGDPGYFELLRDLATERKREAAFKMVVAQSKMMVGLVRFFFEDVCFSCIQVLFLLNSKTTPSQFYFTIASIAAGVLMSILGPITEAVNSRKHRLEAGDAAVSPPPVDGGAAQSTQPGSPGDGKGEQALLLDNSTPEHLAYEQRVEQALQTSKSELFVGNTDYIDILMEKPEEPALVPDVAITDIIASRPGVRKVLCCGVVMFWSFIVSVPFVFDISCEHGIPSKANLSFLAIAFLNLFLQIWCAAQTKYGYLTLVHAPQMLGLNLFLALLGLFDSYSDMAFVAMLEQCNNWLWKPAAAVFLVGVLLMQALPGVIFLASGHHIPAALKLNEMNVLLMLLKPSIN